MKFLVLLAICAVCLAEDSLPNSGWVPPPPPPPPTHYQQPPPPPYYQQPPPPLYHPPPLDVDSLVKKLLNVVEERGSGGTFNSSLFAKVMKIDSYSSLSIYRYFDSRDSDKIVQEYVDNLISINFVPEIPKGSDNIWFTLPDDITQNLSSGTVAKVVTLFMLYFQTRNFPNKIAQATTAHQRPVFDVNPKPLTQAFQFAPNENLRRMPELKQGFAMEIQGVHRESSKFINEFLILRAANYIYSELKQVIRDPMELRRETQAHINVLFYKSLIQFVRQFRAKNIDRRTYDNMARNVEPSWGTQSSEPPMALKTPYNAPGIFNKIRNKQLYLHSAEVFENCLHFPEDCHKMITEAQDEQVPIENPVISTKRVIAAPLLKSPWQPSRKSKNISNFKGDVIDRKKPHRRRVRYNRRRHPQYSKVIILPNTANKFLNGFSPQSETLN